MAGHQNLPTSWKRKKILNPSSPETSYDFRDSEIQPEMSVLWDWSQLMVTLPKANIAPETMPSQKEISIPTIHFQVAILVSGNVMVTVIGDLGPNRGTPKNPNPFHKGILSESKPPIYH